MADKKLQIRVITLTPTVFKRDTQLVTLDETNQNRSSADDDPPMSYSSMDTDEIYFYDSANRYFLFSCDNSSKKALPPHTNEAIVRRAVDLDRLNSIKCDRMC